MVYSPNCLSKNTRHFQDLQFPGILWSSVLHSKFFDPPHVLLLRHCVRHNDLVKTRVKDSINTIATEHTVRDQGEDLARTLLFQRFAARVMVFEVSAKSSTKMHTRSLTLPTSKSAEC